MYSIKARAVDSHLVEPKGSTASTTTGTSSSSSHLSPHRVFGLLLRVALPDHVLYSSFESRGQHSSLLSGVALPLISLHNLLEPCYLLGRCGGRLLRRLYLLSGLRLSLLLRMLLRLRL